LKIKNLDPVETPSNQRHYPGMENAGMTVETCRERAAECRRMAKVAPFASHRIMLLHMAETWERIARDVENANGHT
jgi:hypothetical protein